MHKHIKVVIVLFVLLINVQFSSSFVIENTDDDIQITKLAFVGDILMTENVQKTADNNMNLSIEDPYIRVASGFEYLFSDDVKEILADADITFGNLENPIAEGLTENWHYDENGKPVCEEIQVEPGVLCDNQAYRFNPIMIVNAHPALAFALKNVGFDIVSTANNHYLNRGVNGIDKTIDALRKADLDFVGTIRSDELIDVNNEGYPDNQAYVIKEVNGIKIAFLGFATKLNNMDSGFQLKTYFMKKYPKADEIGTRQLYSIMSNNSDIEFNVKNFCDSISEAKNNSDIVCVSCHFGNWFYNFPSKLQKKISKRFLESGGDVIIGHGPHVLQPIDEYHTLDGRKTFIFYSLGNFLIDSTDKLSGNIVTSYITIIGAVDIVNNSGAISLDSYSYTPSYIYKTSDDETQVILGNKQYLIDIVPDYDKIMDTIFNCSNFDLWLITQRQLSKCFGSRILALDDVLLDHWFYRKWDAEQN